MARSTPRILLIVREPVKSDARTKYDRLETDTAVLAVKLRCPHPYLALEPLSGAKNEVWWLAGLAGVVVGSVWNYAVSSVFTWKQK